MGQLSFADIELGGWGVVRRGFAKDSTNKAGLTISQIPAFTEFTTLNHGARWGGPVTHFSGLPDSNDDPNLVHIDALFYRFSAFDKAYSDATIKKLSSSHKYDANDS